MSEEQAIYETKDNELVFTATLPEIQSAISVGADGARLKIDVGETDIDEVLKLARYGRGKLLRVAVRIDEP